MHRLLKARNNIRHGNRRVKRRNFGNLLFLKQSALAALDDNILEIFETIFIKYDRDKKGFITAKDILPIMQELGLPVSNHSVQSIIVEMDADGNGAISFEEFSSVMAMRMIFPYPVDKVRKACDMFDDNSDGQIRSEDIQFAMEELLPHPMSHEEADNMISDLFEGESRIHISKFVDRVRQSLLKTGKRNKVTAGDAARMFMKSSVETGNPK